MSNTNRIEYLKSYIKSLDEQVELIEKLREEAFKEIDELEEK